MSFIKNVVKCSKSPFFDKETANLKMYAVQTYTFQQ